jgi:hypothetical protein
MRVIDMNKPNMEEESSNEQNGISRREFMKNTGLFGAGVYGLLNGIGLFNPEKSDAQEPAKKGESIDDILYKENYTLALAIGVWAGYEKDRTNIKTGIEKKGNEFNIGATSFGEKDGKRVPYSITMDYNTLVRSGINFTDEQKKGILAYMAENKATEKVSTKECKYWPIALTEEQGKKFLIAGKYLLESPDGKLSNNPKKPLHFRSGRDRPHAADLFTEGSGYAPSTIRCDAGTNQHQYFPAAFLMQPYAKK